MAEEVRNLLLSEDITAIHTLFTKASDQDHIFLEVFSSMLEPIQSKVFINILNYAKTSQKYLENVLSYLMSLDWMVNQKPIFKNSIGLKRFLTYIATKIPASLHDVDKSTDLETLKCLNFFEVYYANDKLPEFFTPVNYFLQGLLTLYAKKPINSTIQKINANSNILKQVVFQDDENNTDVQMILLHQIKKSICYLLLDEKFVSASQGQEFLSKILISADEDLQMTLKDLIFAKINCLDVSKVGHLYGQLVFKTWKNSEEDSLARKFIDVHLIQKVMDLGCTVKNESIFKELKSFLLVFYEKHAQGQAENLNKTFYHL